MIERVDAPISVKIFFDHKSRKSVLKELLWEGRIYRIEEVDLHHTYRDGRTLFHIFSVRSPTLYFKLIFNTDTLNWRVEEIADGQPD